MMQNGKSNYIRKWGLARFVYAYLMLKLNRLIGFRISAVRAKAIQDSQLDQFDHDGINYRALSLEDFSDEALNQHLDISCDFVQQALARGDHCVGALDQGKVVGYAWRTTSSVKVDRQIAMKFGDKLYYRFKGYILPEYRGRNIFNNIKRVAESKQLALGRTHAFGCIETHNYPSLKASEKHGDITIGYSAYIENRLVSKHWQSKGAKIWGVTTYHL
jgi:hypothetical protein